MKTLFLFFIINIPIFFASFANEIKNYNIVWESPSQNSAESMPLGNGELGANLWVEENGDLIFYLSRTDAISEANRLMKLGRIRVSFSPNPFIKGNKFSQTLLLEDGIIKIKAGSENKTVNLYFYMDSDNDVAYLNMDSNIKLNIKVQSESWREKEHIITKEESLSAWLLNMPDWVKVMESADVFKDIDNRICWYHHNSRSDAYNLTIKNQRLEEYTNNFPDPIKNRTFGASIFSKELKKVDLKTLTSHKPINSFSLKITTHSCQSSVKEWLNELETISKKSNAKQALENSRKWWKNLWDRSYLYIDIPDNKEYAYLLTQSYILQRYMFACSGNGNFPIKFNGSIFTAEPQFTNGINLSPDYRNWGNDFWWQNTRLPYYSMLMNGDFLFMKPLFNFYISRMKAFKTLAKLYYNAKGAFIPETITIFGTYANGDYGWKDRTTDRREVQSLYIRHIWVQSLELSKLMLDYASFTGNVKFLRESALPTIKDFMDYFSSRFTDSNGRIDIKPTQSLETYWFNVENDMPVIAGLHYITKAISELPESLLNNNERNYYKNLASALPALPMKKIANGTIFLPAQVYLEKRNNVENPELYSVFPFGLSNFSNDLHQTGILTFKNRNFKCNVGWGQDGQIAAILGLTDEVQIMLEEKVKNTNKNHRFLTMWGPNFDWIPDQDHGANIILTLQNMILQHYNDTSYILPAWPDRWNVKFKLYSGNNSCIEGSYINGDLKYKCKGDIRTKSMK